LDGHGTINAATHESTEMTKTPLEYNSANMILRELHILNQHRLMFSPLASNSSMPQMSSLNRTHQLPSPLAHIGHSTPTPKLHPTPMQTSQLYNPEPPRYKTAEEDQFQAGPLAEVDVVSENYENMNKFLGSLFLSRRRVLDSSFHGVPHS